MNETKHVNTVTYWTHKYGYRIEGRTSTSLSSTLFYQGQAGTDAPCLSAQKFIVLSSKSRDGQELEKCIDENYNAVVPECST